MNKESIICVSLCFCFLLFRFGRYRCGGFKHRTEIEINNQDKYQLNIFFFGMK